MISTVEDLRRFDRALEIFQGVVARNPNDVDALSAVAYIHRRQGKLERTLEGHTAAVRDLEEARRTHDDVMTTQARLALLRALARLRTVERARRG